MSVFALSLELLVGQTGLVSFGHAAFFGIGGLRRSATVTANWSRIVLDSASCGAGRIRHLRARSGRFVAANARHLFHHGDTRIRADGVLRVSRHQGRRRKRRHLFVLPSEIAIGEMTLLDLGSPIVFYFFILVALVLTFLLLASLQRSRFGRALAGIRVNEQRMRAAGFATYPYKLAAFVIAAMLAGVAGFLYALKDGYVNPEILSWHQSGAVLLMIILGGIGSLRGAVFGAIAFVALQEFYQSQAIFGSFAKHWQLPLGLTIIAFVALMPQGLIGLGTQLRRRAAA